MKRSAFTMVELIFVIVIIGVLASIGIPKLSGVSDGAKKTAEIAAISAVSTAIESAHGEWSINENAFTWGNNRPSTELNSVGYPNDLNASGKVFGAILKGDSADFTKIGNTIVHADYNISIFTGPASNATNGVKFDTKAPNSDIAGKPDKNDFWIYASYVTSTKTCTYNGKTFFSGDFLLIDVIGIGTTNYAVALTCT
ncbi:MAG: type II secretion system protein [Sulfurospirillaceae bacterium]|nr:type II secretion system protein [Sulfurospirillaceae bacterium]